VVRWLDDEEMRAWRGLREVFGDVHAALDAELLALHGLSEGEYAVLVCLSEAPAHQVRMRDLAARLHLSPSGMTRRLDRLVHIGYVRRRASAEDGRVTLAELTRRGASALEAAAPDHVDGVRRHLLDHLSRAQIRELGSMLASVQRRRAASGDAARHAS
jgi:DNA-binding MarR family transcriptional regulator